MRPICLLYSVSCLLGCSASYRDDYDSLKQRAAGHSAWTSSPSGSAGELEAKLLTLRDAEASPDFTKEAALEDLVRLTLARNPELRAAVKRLEAAIEKIPQAASARDPEIELAFSFEDFFRRLMSQMIELMQPLLFPGKLDAAARKSIEEASREWQMLQERALDLRASVARDYADIHALDHALRIAGDNRKLIEQLETVARARYEARQTPQQDVLKVRLRAYALENDILRMTRERRETEARLNAMIGRRAMMPIGATRVPDAPAEPEALEALFARALERRPEVAATTHGLRASLAALRMAELESWPDGVLKLDVERFRGGSYEVTPKIAVPLTMLRPARREAAEAEARAMLGESWHRYEGARVEIARQVAAAHARVVETRASIQLYTEKLRPQAKQTHESALAGYRAGEVDFLTAVDALIEFQAVEEQFHRLLGDHLAAREALRHATGEHP